MDVNTIAEQNVSCDEVVTPPKKKKGIAFKNHHLAVLIFAVVAAIFSIVRIYIIQDSVESPGFVSGNANYKLETNFSTQMFLVLYLVFGVAALVFGILCKKMPFAPSKRSNGYVFVSSLAGFCMVGCAGFFIYRRTLRESSMSNIDYWVIILMLFTGVYLAMDAVGFVSKKLKPWFATGVTLYGLVRLFSEFLALHEVQYYSSNEYHLVSLVATLLFLCCDARMQIDGTAGIGYTAFGLFAVLSLWVYAIPEMYISLFSPVFAPYYVDSVFVFCIVDAVFGFYIVAKLFSVREKKSSGECEVC